MYCNDVDPFKDIRVLPRESAQLRHHLSRINHTLQTKYFVSSEISELALQPDRSDEFFALYKSEIQRVAAKLNANAKGKHYAVRVDPLRLTAGFELRCSRGRDNDYDRLSNAEGMTSTPPLGNIEAKWAASLAETKMQLAQQHLLDSNRLAFVSALQSTPASQQSTLKKMATGGCTTGCISSDAVDSDVRKINKESLLFTTPPEFNGFAPAETPSSEKDSVE